MQYDAAQLFGGIHNGNCRKRCLQFRGKSVVQL